jgi:hypothetical protein
MAIRYIEMTELQQFSHALRRQAAMVEQHIKGKHADDNPACYRVDKLDCPGCHEQGTISEYCARQRESQRVS